MKKRNVIAVVLCSMCLTVGSLSPAAVMADSTKVVTLGADLTQEQKDTMMRYFKADANQVQILTITNQDERDHLGKYVPLEQIGTRTLSCAYVKPTQSGGIKVRTANLNYVTGNMIANALSTAGVSNCEAVAACPYEVSGTGALTGVIMAYEDASGQKLDSTKKDLATKEVVVTGDLAQQVGQDNATNIINQAKLQIIGENVQNADEIYNIVNNLAVQNNVTLSSDEMDAIVSLLQQIAQQSYDIKEMKETLESIQENLDKESADATATPAPEENVADEDKSDGVDTEDDITQNVDPGVLGDDIKESSTEDPTLEDETMGDISQNGDQDGTGDDGTGIPPATDDGTVQDNSGETPAEDGSQGTDDGTGIPPATEDGTVDEGTEAPAEDGSQGTDDGMTVPPATEDGSTGEDGSVEAPAEDGSEQIPDQGTTDENVSGDYDFDTSTLSEEAKEKFDKAKTFCAGAYEGDTAALEEAMGPGATTSMWMDSNGGKQLTQKVLEAYLNVLKDGGQTYVPADTDKYMSAELNMTAAEMKKIFSIDAEPAADDMFANASADLRQILYDETMKFFEKLYGENTTETSADGTESGETAAAEGTADGTASADSTAVPAENAAY